MVTIIKKPGSVGVSRASRTGQIKPTYAFKSARELPISKPDYVVLSPTPLGQRPVAEAKQEM